jgi:hypothetical protein
MLRKRYTKMKTVKNLIANEYDKLTNRLSKSSRLPTLEGKALLTEKSEKG